MSKLHKALGKTTGIEKDFLRALINKEPVERVYADWLSEQGREPEAAILRAKAGISKVCFTLRHKPSGITWKTLYTKLGDLRNKLAHSYSVVEIKFSNNGKAVYFPLEECEVIVVEYVQNIHSIPLPWNAIDVPSQYRYISLTPKDDNPILL